MGHSLDVAGHSEPLATASIVIVNWNGSNFIGKCLESVLKTKDSHFEVIVVDNASTDGSDRIVALRSSTDQRVKLIRLRENVGFAAGNNIGAINSTGEYLVLLNPDTMVDPEWLAPLLEKSYMSSNCIIQSK